MSNAVKDTYKIPVADEDYFSNLHTMVLTIGFPRSGSSLIGYLLTAHPNIIMAHEPDLGKHLYEAQEVYFLLNYILYADKFGFNRAKEAQNFGSQETSPSNKVGPRVFYPKNRYVYVPNQWQNYYKSLEVIGIKGCLSTTVQLSEESVLEQLKKLLRKQKISLKFIFTVRNPYDIVITTIMNRAHQRHITDKNDMQKMMAENIKIFSKRCTKSLNILSLVKTQHVFMNRHEDMVATPTEQLAKLCRFLGVEASEDYLNDCAAVVHEKPRKSRYELDWTEEQKEKVAEMIEQYDFLSHYSWSS